MHKSEFFRLKPTAIILASVLLLAAAVRRSVWIAWAQSPAVAASNDDASLLDGFRHVEVASVSDAMEQITGRRIYMSHRMQPIFPAKFAGFAVTLKLKKDEGNTDP